MIAKAYATCTRCGQEVAPSQEVGGEHGLRHHAGASLPACKVVQDRRAARIAASADPRSDGRYPDYRAGGHIKW